MKWTDMEIFDKGCSPQYDEYKRLRSLVFTAGDGYRKELAEIDNKIKNLNVRINELEAYLK